MFSAETGLSETLLGPGQTLSSLVNKQVDLRHVCSCLENLGVQGSGGYIFDANIEPSRFWLNLEFGNIAHRYGVYGILATPIQQYSQKCSQKCSQPPRWEGTCTSRPTGPRCSPWPQGCPSQRLYPSGTAEIVLVLKLRPSHCALHQGGCLRHESRGHGLLRPGAQGGLRLHLGHKDARPGQVTEMSSMIPNKILPTQIQLLSLQGTEWSLPPASWRRGPGRCWRPTTEGPNRLAVMTQFDVTQHNHNKPDKYMQQTVFHI